jgi:hypothetical protein
MHRLLRVSPAITLAILALSLPASAAKLDPNVAHGKKVLYVYNQTKLEQARAANPPNPTRLALIETQRANDKRVIAFLESLGFVVTGANESSSVDAAKGEDLILISESVDALDVGAKYRDVPVPLITFENDLLPFLGMTGQKNDVDTGTKEKQRLVWLVNAPHPLAAGLTPGFQNVLDDENVRMNWGKPTPAAITIATIPGESDKAAIFAYEKGATMNWEFLAPARRVSFFLYSDTFEHLRPEGIALFRAALLWAVSSPE